MSAIVPPLDVVPKLPAKAVNLVLTQLDNQTDKLLESVTNTLQDSIKLPNNIKCDDPRVDKIKNQLADIQQQIIKVQEQLPKIQQTINSVKQLVTIAQGIKTAITVAQLSNPVTAPVFIANQLMAIQDATIVNAIESLNQFAIIPTTLTSKLQTIVKPLSATLSKISSACNGNIDSLDIPASVTDYNDFVPTEFYTELNVSDIDLENRSDIIEQLIAQQQDLLTSLSEAPSKVYQGEGVPVVELGKQGDYYIDTTTQKIYGPKMSLTNWEVI
jgi:hypothetical protein